MVSFCLAQPAMVGDFRAVAPAVDKPALWYTGLGLQQPGCLPACDGQGMEGYGRVSIALLVILQVFPAARGGLGILS